jgi:hypothetical protein
MFLKKNMTHEIKKSKKSLFARSTSCWCSFVILASRHNSEPVLTLSVSIEMKIDCACHSETAMNSAKEATVRVTLGHRLHFLASLSEELQKEDPKVIMMF